MKLTESNIVLTGGFNPNIIEPGWLMRESVVTEQREEFEVEFQVAAISGADNSIRFELDRIKWEVGLERVKLASRDGTSPAPWIERLLERLPHTPIRAVGNNFQFRCSRAEWNQVVPALPENDTFAELLGEQVSSALISRTKLPDKTQINLNLTITPNEAMFDTNVHRGANRHEVVRRAIAEFDRDRDRIRQVVQIVSGQEVTQ